MKFMLACAACSLSIAAIAGVGCSSSNTKSGDEEQIPTAAADAETDSVPKASAENKDAPPAPDANADVPPSPKGDAQADATPPSPAGSGQFDNYTVAAGDTLMKIAFETYGDLYRWKSIAEANKDTIKNPNSIPAGTVLKVEKPVTAVTIERNGDKYEIKKGDTLGTISADVYGTKAKWKKLYENNKQLIHDPNKIYAGFFLYYSQTPEEKAEAEKMKSSQPPTMSPATLGSAPAPAGDRAPASAPPAGNGSGGGAPAGDAPPPPPPSQ